MAGNRIEQIRATPQSLQRLGPSLQVDIEIADPSPNSPVDRIKNILALVDTGASASAISPRLAARFSLAHTKTRSQFTIYGKAENVPTYFCKLLFPCGVDVTDDFAVLDHLSEPNEILIGRNLLARSQITIDFVSGIWAISFNI
jgi:predicted aspartyl protease